MEMKHKCSPDNLGNVLILGEGVTGKAVEDYLAKQPNRALTVDVVTEEELANSTKSYDLCIASPGISEFSDFYANAKMVSREVISEVEFAYRESEIDSKWIAITGTNGKTTTTSLTEHILTVAGINAVAVGNIGQTCISQVDGQTKVYVAECSSYQLASTSKFDPDACAILNITPDHIKWHEGLENYRNAKFKIFANLRDNADALVFLEHHLKSQIPGIDSFACKVVTDKNSDKAVLVASLAEGMKIKGEHNIQNAVCAAALTSFMGVSDSTIKEALLSFSPLEHRIEPCGDVDGVAFYNDSKATNVDSTIKALSAFPQGRVILLLGGTDKGSDLTPLVNECKRPAGCGPVVSTVICYGDSKARFLESFNQLEDEGIPVLEANKLSDAFALAVKKASDGDSVLLSPACASFDEFSGFEERGRRFKQLVEQLNA